jgi:hypothetical protein
VKSLTLFKRRLDPERVTGGRSFVIEATGLVRAYDQGTRRCSLFGALTSS